MPSKKPYVLNFPGHLADCEFNYRRLSRLMPNWPGGQSLSIDSLTQTKSWDYLVGNISGSEIAVSIQAFERARYTTTVHIAVYSRLQKKVAWVKNHRKDGLKSSLPFIRRRTPVAESTDKTSGWRNRLSEKQLPVKQLPEEQWYFDNSLNVYSLDVRLYHDATVAEVIAWEGRRQFRARHTYPNCNMYHSDEKAQLNRFLGELLAFCLQYGRVMQDIVPV
jgi:uncharacterized protein YqiB (DUF1249 family)